MNAARAIADPHVSLHRQLGERITEARHQTERLENTLRHIDELRATLREQGVTVDVDLGDVGNVAAEVRRQVEAGSLHRKTFELPRPQPKPPVATVA